MINNNWTEEVNNILEKIRKNSIELSNRHRLNFYEYKGYSKYFDIPIIVVSVLSSSFSVGATSFLNQELVSVSTCGISMLVAILTSVKLYLQLDENIKKEFEMSKSFHTLALDLYMVLNLKTEQRNGDGLEFLNKKYSDYIKLIESSNLLRKHLKKDFLLEIESYLLNDNSSVDTNEELTKDNFNLFQNEITDVEEQQQNIELTHVEEEEEKNIESIKQNDNKKTTIDLNINYSNNTINNKKDDEINNDLINNKIFENNHDENNEINDNEINDNEIHEINDNSNDDNVFLNDENV